MLPHEELNFEEESSSLLDDTEPGVALLDVSASGRAKQASPPTPPVPPVSLLKKPQFIRQREVLQLRMRCEMVGVCIRLNFCAHAFRSQQLLIEFYLSILMACQDFANLVEDERYREGRLLRRWFELLEGRRPTSDTFSSPVSPAETEVNIRDLEWQICASRLYVTAVPSRSPVQLKRRVI